jgi:ATP-binding cassette subfamily B protein/ATP-binding cassette subfamily C protein
MPEPAPAQRSGLAVRYWEARDEEFMSAGLRTMARELPALVGGAARTAWQASRLDAATTLGLNLAAGLFTTVALLAVNSVLESLFAAGPTTARLRAAIGALLLVAGATALRAGLLAGASWAQARLKPQVERLAETRLLQLTSHVELAAFDDQQFHDAMQRARDSGVPDSATMVDMTVNVVNGAVGVLATIITLGVLQPVLMPLLLITAVPGGWAAMRAARMRYAAYRRVSTARRRKFMLSDLMAERPPAAEVRAFTLRDYLLAEYDRVADHVQQVELDVARQQTAVLVAGNLMTGAATVVAYVALGGLLATSVIPLAVAGTAVLTIRAGGASLTGLMQSLNKLYEAGLYFGDYLDFCALAKTRVPVRQATTPPVTFDRLTADGVTFTYPGADRRALRDMTVTVAQGEVIALVGENGSGKTTLAKLLAGLYRPDSGVIRWDSTDLGEINGDELRERISVIAQDHTRWPLTARENITMGRPLDEKRLADAAAAAGAADLIAALPRGYDTLLDRRFHDGHDLSGGQWQRIAIARAFYRDAALMIFDEPTSALDARAEHALFERIRTHADRRTVILITHRLASVRYADRIYVLAAGSIVEQGTHAELMLLNGTYAQMYELQAAAYRERESRPV